MKKAHYVTCLCQHFNYLNTTLHLKLKLLSCHVLCILSLCNISRSDNQQLAIYLKIKFDDLRKCHGLHIDYTTTYSHIPLNVIFWKWHWKNHSKDFVLCITSRNYCHQVKQSWLRVYKSWKCSKVSQESRQGFYVQ